MSRRVHLISEFAAHTARVNCAKLSSTDSGLLLTGGDDAKVNVWAAASARAILSLSGNASAVECVAFDGPEDIIGAGAATGSVKLWSLETGKLIRTLTGHRSNCLCLDFHPFGDYCVTGSLDTNVKIWDSRRKGCVQTFKDHSCPLSAVNFTPDGKWAVSADKQGKVKVWDLQASRLLHTMSQHTSEVSSIAFHPNELLMATGSRDRTVRFWDMESFESIGIAGPDAVGVLSMLFSPCGSAILSGYQDSLRVYGYEPVHSFDVVDVNWQKIVTLAYFNPENDDATTQLLGCALHQQSVSLWSVDLANVNPFGKNVANREDFLRPKPERGGGKQQQQQEAIVRSNGSSVNGLTTTPSKPLQQQQQQVAVMPPPSRILHPRNHTASAASASKKSSDFTIYEMNKQFQNVEHHHQQQLDSVNGKHDPRRDSSGNNEMGWLQHMHSRKEEVDEEIEEKENDGSVGLSMKRLSFADDTSSSYAARKKTSEPNDLSSNFQKSQKEESEIMSEIMGKHKSLRGLLSKRLSNLRVLRKLWQRGDHTGIASLLSACQDDTLTADFASAAVATTVTAENLAFGTLPLVLPLFASLIQSERVSLVAKGLRVIHSLLRTYGGMISTTLLAVPAGNIGVDLSREERLERYRSVAKAFAKVRPALEGIIIGCTTRLKGQSNSDNDNTDVDSKSGSGRYSEIESLTREVLEMHDRHIISSLSAQ